MIEQINIALEQKWSGNFSKWPLKPAVETIAAEREHTSIKSDEE